MNKPAPAQLYNIPAGAGFIDSLTTFITQTLGALPPLERTDALILLPTRRAKRLLQAALIRQSEHNALIMPRIQTIGDIDEDDINLSVLISTAGQHDQRFLDRLTSIPPALSRMKRQLLLARLIQKPADYAQDFSHALHLAATLGQFMDHVYTEGLRWDKLETLADQDFAAHWQITLDFLKIITDQWPKILKEQGKIDYSHRRTLLLNLLNDVWQAHPPQTPIIAAGSTGSIPAVAHLLKTIAHLPRGHVILPGLDTHLPAEDWAQITPVHPQFTLKRLLEKIDVKRKAVHNLYEDNGPNTSLMLARNKLSSEIMRPAETTHKWLNLDKSKISGLSVQNISVLECQNEKEEATTIALALRALHEAPHKTAVVITPDRHLATRIAAHCKRWGIAIDDSAGLPLSKTDIGVFSMLALNTISNAFSPLSLLSLCRHPFFKLLDNDAITLLDRVFRGLKPAKGFDGLCFCVKRYFCRFARRDHTEDEKQALSLKYLDLLDHTFLTHIRADQHQTLHQWVQQHITLLDAIAQTAHRHIAYYDSLFCDQFLTFADELQDSKETGSLLSFDDYKTVFITFLEAKTVRTAPQNKASVHILGQLEARLLDADLVIMAGLNEGTWPHIPKHDPWMSRKMRLDFGLPDHDHSIGLAAHDFAQGLCMPQVLITRALKTAGTQNTPARWLLRLNAVLKATTHPQDIIFDNVPYRVWARILDQPTDFTPCKRPAPRPPIAARPRKLSATEIEKWLQDPYSIYARKILKLKKYDALEQNINAAHRGTILHATLEAFNATFKHNLPEDSAKTIQNLLLEKIDAYIGESAVNTPEWAFFVHKASQLLEKYIGFENAHRHYAKPVAQELYGQTTLNIGDINFTLSARADRIDHSQNGYIIIDYKSAGNFTQKGFSHGTQAQMPVESLILQAGGFTNMKPPCIVHDLQYWTLNNHTNGVNVTASGSKTAQITAHTLEKIEALIAHFYTEPVPYYCMPNPLNTLHYNDFEHLSRIREWGIISADNDQNSAGGS
jgi:ATP-dependent helicase/nuclease subunit B